MKIVVYGGSFNPPHLGHVEAARTVSAELAPDKFLIIPTNVSPHKMLAEGSPEPRARLEMCRLAFAGIPGAEISDMELQREGKSYTAQTVEELRRSYPDDELFLVMGTDMLLSFESWYRFEYLLENCTLAVLARDEDEDVQLIRRRDVLTEKYGAKVVILKHDPVAASSSDIRERLRFGIGSELLPDSVYDEVDYCPDITIESADCDGTVTDSLYDMTALEKKDKYELFLGGNYAKAVLRTGVENGKHLLLIKDSFANSLVPFLCGDYETITMVDLRYCREKIQPLADEADDVLVLYEITNFAADGNLFKLNLK